MLFLCGANVAIGTCIGSVAVSPPGVSYPPGPLAPGPGLGQSPIRVGPGVVDAAIKIPTFFTRSFATKETPGLKTTLTVCVKLKMSVTPGTEEITID